MRATILGYKAPILNTWLYYAEVDRDWLNELVKPLEEDELVAFSTSKILVHNGEKINTCGNLLVSLSVGASGKALINTVNLKL